MYYFVDAVLRLAGSVLCRTTLLYCTVHVAGAGRLKLDGEAAGRARARHVPKMFILCRCLVDFRLIPPLSVDTRFLAGYSRS